MSHSIIPPSSAAIWAPENGCPGWVTMSKRFPETERSEPAERGTAAHELAATMIQCGARGGVGMPNREGGVIGTTTSNGIVVDDLIFDAARVYANCMIWYMKDRSIFGGQNLGIEAAVKAPSVHEKSFGTLDFFMYDHGAVELIIADLKNGFGVVEVFENWQLVNYAVGVIDALKLWNIPGLKIRFIIAQPNAYHRDGPIREWETTRDELAPMFHQLSVGARIALGDDPETRSGGHCRYCRARHACVAAVTAGGQLYEMVSDVEPVNMTTAEMASQFRFVSRASAHLKSLALAFEEQLKTAARKGEPIPGYQMLPGASREAWTKPTEEIIRLGEMLGEDLRQREPITPKQARDRGVNDTVISAFSKRNPSGLRLVAVDPSHVRKVFGS